MRIAGIAFFEPVDDEEGFLTDLRCSLSFLSRLLLSVTEESKCLKLETKERTKSLGQISIT